MTTFGLNILQQVRNSGNVFPALARLKPQWCVVQDEHKLALAMREQGYNVIFRAKHPNDANFHEHNERGEYKLSPEAFMASYRPLAQNGIVLQVLNEPAAQVSIDDAHINLSLSMLKSMKLRDWLLEVIALANQEGVQLCVANFAMGNPHESLVASGVYDELLKAIVRGDHILGLHEYAKRGQLQHYIGRYRNWLERARVIGVRGLKICITEAGWDIVGGEGDGWHAHITAQQYADLLKRMGAVYAVDHIPACVFSWGDGFSWREFNIEEEPVILDALSDVNAQAAIPAVSNLPPANYDWGTRREVYIVNKHPDGARVREQPDLSAKELTAITTRLKVKSLSSNTWKNDGYEWYEVVLFGGLTGYIANVAIARIETPTGNTQEMPLPPKPTDTVEVPPVTLPPEPEVTPPAPELPPVLPPITDAPTTDAPGVPVDGPFVQLPELKFETKAEAMRIVSLLEAIASAIRNAA